MSTETMKARKGMMARLLALLAAALAACAIVAAPQAYADEGLVAGNVQLGDQATWSTNAVLMSDGFIYPADEKGAKTDETWDGTTTTKTLDSIKGHATKLFVAADVQTLSKTVKFKYENSSGRELKSGTYSITTIIPKLQKVEFLTKSGKSSVSRIEDNTFRNAKLLDEVVNFDKTGISEVPKYCFYGCECLVSISLPDSATSVATYAFYGCLKLNVLNFGNSLVSIGNAAFKGCEELGAQRRAVIFPRTFTTLGSYAFENCQNLHTIIFLNQEKEIILENKSVFKNTSLSAVYVTNRLLVNYDTGAGTKNWDELKSMVHGFLEIESVADVTYTGKALKPKPVVTWCGTALSDSNYTVSYSDNTNVGAGTVKVTGKGKYALKSGSYWGIFSDEYIEYTAAAVAQFTINPRSIAGATVSGLAAKKTFSGKAIKQNNLSIAVNGVTLVADKDFSISYSKNKDVGEAKLTITGKGNYKGSISKTFTIAPKSIKGAKLKLNKTKLVYNGKKRVPKVKTVGGKTLKAGTDYKVKTSKSSPKNVGTYKIWVVGKGNYTGTSAKATYKITKAKNTIKVAATNWRVKYNGKKSVVVKKPYKVTSAKGSYTFKKTKGDSRIVVSKNGRLTLKPGLARNKVHRFTVKVTAKGNKNYKSKTITLKDMFVIR